MWSKPVPRSELVLVEFKFILYLWVRLYFKYFLKFYFQHLEKHLFIGNGPFTQMFSIYLKIKMLRGLGLGVGVVMWSALAEGVIAVSHYFHG